MVDNALIALSGRLPQVFAWGFHAKLVLCKMDYSWGEHISDNVQIIETWLNSFKGVSWTNLVYAIMFACTVFSRCDNIRILFRNSSLSFETTWTKLKLIELETFWDILTKITVWQEIAHPIRSRGLAFWLADLVASRFFEKLAMFQTNLGFTYVNEKHSGNNLV